MTPWLRSLLAPVFLAAVFAPGCEDRPASAPAPATVLRASLEPEDLDEDLDVEIFVVTRVVDGDTVELQGGEKVRLIGVDTPETVDPRRPVEYFGREASAFTRRHLEGEEVRLEYDPANAASRHRDRYGRLLAYVHRARDRLDFNAELVRRGYGHVYTKYPFERMAEFRGYEREARETGRGLWAKDALAAPDLQDAPVSYKRAAPRRASSAGNPTFYVTRTGAKYHRPGCRHLRNSRIPVSLRELRKDGQYGPCSVCRPPR